MSWSAYCTHYLSYGVYKSHGFFAGKFSCAQLKSLLPDFSVTAVLDGSCSLRIRIIESVADASTTLLREIFEITEKEFTVSNADTLRSSNTSSRIRSGIRCLRPRKRAVAFSTRCSFPSRSIFSLRPKAISHIRAPNPSFWRST